MTKFRQIGSEFAFLKLQYFTDKSTRKACKKRASHTMPADGASRFEKLKITESTDRQWEMVQLCYREAAEYNIFIEQSIYVCQESRLELANS